MSIAEIKNRYSEWEEDPEYFNQLYNDLGQLEGAFYGFHAMAMVAPILGVSSTIVGVKMFEFWRKEEEVIQEKG